LSVKQEFINFVDRPRYLVPTQRPSRSGCIRREVHLGYLGRLPWSVVMLASSPALGRQLFPVRRISPHYCGDFWDQPGAESAWVPLLKVAPDFDPKLVSTADQLRRDPTTRSARSMAQTQDPNRQRGDTQQPHISAVYSLLRPH
jgi:hypothetical protein